MASGRGTRASDVSSGRWHSANQGNNRQWRHRDSKQRAFQRHDVSSSLIYLKKLLPGSLSHPTQSDGLQLLLQFFPLNHIYFKVPYEQAGSNGVCRARSCCSLQTTGRYAPFGAKSCSSYSPRLSQTSCRDGPVQSRSHSGAEKSFSFQGSHSWIISGSAACPPTGKKRSLSTFRPDRRTILSGLIGKSGRGLCRCGGSLPAQRFHRG